jgi:diguanylate cyclase (GGDEF)-like protein/PAS domain S-box-containing protein
VVVLRAALGATAALSRVLENLERRAEARRAAAKLLAARNALASDRWRAAFEAAPLGMAKVDLGGRLQEINPALCSLVGEARPDLHGRRLSALVYPDDLAVLGGQGNPGKAKGVARAEVRLVRADGRLRWCELSSVLVRDPAGRPDHVLVHVVDITRHKVSQAALRDLATRDPLSGLANRRWLELQLGRHVRACSDGGPKGALLVIDLDNFKAVNDTLGHPAGDRLVSEVALALRRHLRDRDLVARLGGDEFAVLLPDGDRWAAEAVARKLVLAVRDGITAGDAPQAPEVTVSVGVAPFGALQRGVNVAAALRAADAAMYEVKRTGRNGYSVHGAPEGPHHASHRRPVMAGALVL